MMTRKPKPTLTDAERHARFLEMVKRVEAKEAAEAADAASKKTAPAKKTPPKA